MQISKTLIVVSVLFLVDILVVLLHLKYGANIGFLNIDKERSFNAIVSSAQFLCSAIFIFTQVIIFRGLQESWKRMMPWIFLGAGTFYFSLDDLFEIHERIGGMFNKVFHLGGYYGAGFNWLIYFSPFLLVGAYILYFVIRDIARSSKLYASFIAGGLCLFITALGLEYYEGMLLLMSQPPFKLYHTLLLYEELLELLGVSCLLAGIFSFVLKQVQRHVRIVS